MTPSTDLRVLIVAEHASFKFGGEAILPAHYFKGLRQRGIDAWLITHSRTRAELEAAFPSDQSRIFYLPDTLGARALYRLGKFLPARLNYFTFEWLMRMSTQRRARRLARRLVRDLNINIVHQPIPVSPKEPSLLHRLGAPLIIGPMNGGMRFPPDYVNYDSRLVRAFNRTAARAAPLVHHLLRGKRDADLLLVANARTQAALPSNYGKVKTLVENGVDLHLWQPKTYPDTPASPEPTRFLFAARLVDWKGVDILIDATARAAAKVPLRLEIVGEGKLRHALEARVADLRLSETITFTGWLSQGDLARHMSAADVFVLPSLRECGGAVILEAMASALPTIALNWGGPADYLDNQTGILLDPAARAELVVNLSQAMIDLAQDPHRRKTMGLAARAKVESEFTWAQKIDQMIEIYRDLLAAQPKA
jgi:glycosyltransferase involved in cell wall biosynthesis